MPTPAPRPEPVAAAQRVKDLAHSAVSSAQSAVSSAQSAAVDLARDLAQRYERSSRHFKLRAAVVASWAALALLGLWIACPSSGPRNGHGAEARLGDQGLLGPQVLVRNESDRIWTDVALVLDGGWRYERRTVRPGEPLVALLSDFRRDGQPPPRDFRPRQLTIQSREGDATMSLSARERP